MPPISSNAELMKKWRESLEQVPLKSPLPSVPMADKTLHESVLDALEVHSSNSIHPAMIDGFDESHTISHQELRQKILSMAAYLESIGINHGDRVSICVFNSIEYVIACFGVLAVGGTVVGLNAMLKPFEMEFELNEAKPKLIFIAEEMLEKVMQAVQNCDSIKIRVCARLPGAATPLPEGVIGFEECLTMGPTSKMRNVSVDDTAFIFFTSGSTGLAKGVVVSHQAFTTTVQQWIRHWELEVYPAIGTEKVNWYQEFQISFMSSVFLFGCGVTCFALLSGSPYVFMKSFDPQVYVDVIRKYRPRTLFFHPAIIEFLVKHPLGKAADLSSVQFAMSGGATPAFELSEELLAREKNLLFLAQGYGQTEFCGGSHHPLLLDRNVAYHNVGVIVPQCEQKIVDPVTREVVPRGEKGEVLIRTQTLMKGYLNNEEATREVMDEDGFVKTGDVGYIDENGLLYIVDRLKELINIKIAEYSCKVSPAQVEHTLLSHDKIVEAAVVGIKKSEAPDDDEFIAALIVTNDPTLTEDEIRAYVKEKASVYCNITGKIVFIHKLPRSGSGKVLRPAVREILLKAHQS